MELTHEQQMHKLFGAVTELLAKNIEAHIPGTGSFRTVDVGGHVKGSQYHSSLRVEESYRSETERRVALGVYRDDDDRLVSNYLFHGTKQEVINWLSSPQALEEIIAAYEHLEKKVRNW